MAMMKDEEPQSPAAAAAAAPIEVVDDDVVRILLTGASGYVGQFLLESFAKDPPPPPPATQTHYHIYAVHHSNPGLEGAVEKLLASSPSASSPRTTMISSAPPPSRTTTIQVDALDVGDEAAIVAFLAKNPVDVCIHLAAISSPKLCAEYPDKAKAVNVPQSLVDAFFAQPQHRRSTKLKMIALSTDQVYDGLKQEGQGPYVETDATNPPNLYGQTKVDLEKCLLKAVEASDTADNASASLLRCSLIFGPAKPPLAEYGSDVKTTREPFLHFIASRSTTVTEYYTDEKRSPVSVRDVVAILRWLVVHDDNDQQSGGGGNVYNVGGPDALSRYDLAHAVFAHLGYDPTYMAKDVDGKAVDVIIPVERSKLRPPPLYATPLDAALDSSKVQRLTGLELMDLPAILVDAFGPPVKSQSPPRPN